APNGRLIRPPLAFCSTISKGRRPSYASPRQQPFTRSDCTAGRCFACRRLDGAAEPPTHSGSDPAAHPVDRREARLASEPLAGRSHERDPRRPAARRACDARVHHGAWTTRRLAACPLLPSLPRRRRLAGRERRLSTGTFLAR